MGLSVTFKQTDEDTFRSGPDIDQEIDDAFFALLEGLGIDRNAFTRPRDVPPIDLPYKSQHYAQAAYSGPAREIVCDKSVIEQLRQRSSISHTNPGSGEIIVELS